MPRHPLNDKRLLTAVLLGAAVAAWAGNRTRESLLEHTKPETSTLIDWEQARSLAHGMNRGSVMDAEQRQALTEYYFNLTQRTIPIVADYTGDTLLPTLEQVYAFDRNDWIDANIVGFEAMFRPLEALNPLGEEQSVVANLLWGGLSQKVLSVELGFLLGYLARRVLGQYDMTLLGREPVSAGKLYFVQPNIAHVEQTLDLPREDFRLWLALHETTHAFEFESHPWLRGHVNSLLESYFEFLNQDVETLKRGVPGLKVFWERARSGEREPGQWIQAVMTPQQRELFNAMQATMSVIEGYSNHVMNAVGQRLIPTYEVISKRFERRQRQRTPAERLFARLTGLDIKMEQYRQGEAFINAVVQQRGHDFAKLVWRGPEFMPSLEELRNPDQWIARVSALA